MMNNYYKFTDENDLSCFGGSGKWVLNQWRSVDGEIVPCANGLHLCRARDLLHWLGPKLWVAEIDGEIIEQSDKIVARRARVVEHVSTWNERTARMFACDCAQWALDLVGGPADQRSLTAIDVARRYAQGKATCDELNDAADAAWAAALDAGRAAAQDAALDAAWAAADAARAATDAAGWSAARAAAWNATRAATDAARVAAWAAGWNAARDAAVAARDAAREWQIGRLMQYLQGADLQ